MRRVAWLSLFILVFAGSALAQETSRVDVFVGGSYLRSSGANFRGWNASVAANLNDWFGIVGDFSGHYFPAGNAHLYGYTFGPQVAYHKNAQIIPFAHALFGGATAGGGGISTTGFGMNLGGGLDWVARPKLAIRLIQADALVTRFSGNTSTDARLSFGVVFRFSK